MQPKPTLDFTMNRKGEYVATAGRYTVRLVRDEQPESPWDSWEGNAPYMMAGERFGAASTKGAFPTIGDVCEGWTRPQAKLFCRMAAEAMREPVAAIWRAAIEGSGVNAPAADIAWHIGDAWADYEGNRDPSPVYAAAFRVAGWAHKLHTSTGYCQGDVRALLFVWPPAEVARYGVPADNLARDLDGAAELFDAWAWGDVYGYVIEGPDGEHVDSCYGFYTRDPDSADDDKSGGMASAVLDALPDDWGVDPDIGAAALYSAA